MQDEENHKEKIINFKKLWILDELRRKGEAERQEFTRRKWLSEVLVFSKQFAKKQSLI